MSGFNKMADNLQCSGNLYLMGADPCVKEHNPQVDTEFKTAPILKKISNEWWLEISINPAWKEKRKRTIVTTEKLGRAKVPDAPFEDFNGKPYKIESDYLDRKRDPDNPAPGPFVFTNEKRLKLKVRPPQ